MYPHLVSVPHELQTERLLLRRPRLEDAPTLNAAICASLDRLQVWMAWATKAPTLEETVAVQQDALNKWDEQSKFRLLMWLRSSGELVGTSGFWPLDWKVPSFEIGYWLTTGHEGHGYVHEAILAQTALIFDLFGARRIQICCDAANQKSARTAERAGYTLEARLENHTRNGEGDLRTTLIYARTRPDAD